MQGDEPNYYDILQVSPDADQGVVAAAYRRLARQYHPDLNRDPSAVVRMKELNVAFEVLGDPAKRAAFDARRLGRAVGQPRNHNGYSGSRAVGAMLCLIVGLAIGIPTGMVLIRNAVGGGADPPASALGSGPVFDPAASSCLKQTPVTLDRIWQTSAANSQSDPARPPETFQIGLRDEYGSPTETLVTRARVLGPDGSAFTSAAKILSGQNWTYALYPADFVGAPPLQTGTYTVVWEIAGGFVACDGFVVVAN
jgi:curved DNA-binding protein CbpA